MRNIAEKNNAVYIEGSLVFATGGKHAEALFETVEPTRTATPRGCTGWGSTSTRRVSLLIDPALWAELYPQSEY